MTANLMFMLVCIPIVGAFVSYIIGKQNKVARDWFVIAVTVIEFSILFALRSEASNTNPPLFLLSSFAGHSIELQLDGFRYIYSLIAAFMFMMAAIFSKEYFKHYRNRNRYNFFFLLTVGGTIGTFLSSNLMTLFIFFELMSLASYVWVIHDESKAAKKAAQNYLFVGVIGGMMMLIGIFILFSIFGTTEIAELATLIQNYSGNMMPVYAASVLMMIGFGGKAGVFPIHFWLPEAHPVAPAPSSALLSGILTKTGVYGALIISSNFLLHNYNWGVFILILGTLGMFMGALLGVFSIDLKRTLALSSVSQIGFILVGIGMQGILASHNALAVRGTLLHMINHSLIKLILFMGAGAIYMKLHTLDLNDLRGYGRKKPVLAFIFLMGALAIAGMPGWSGYISKTLLHEAIVEEIWMFTEYSAQVRFFQFIEAMFILSGGFTAAYMTKIFIAIFIEKNPYHQAEHDKYNGNYMEVLSKLTLIIPSIMVFVFGAFPQFYDSIADFGQVFMNGVSPEHVVEYFAWINVKGTLMSLLIGLIVYTMIVRTVMMVEDSQGNRVYVDLWPAWLGWGTLFYEPVFGFILPKIGGWYAQAVSSIPNVASYLPKVGAFVSTKVSAVPTQIGDFIKNEFNKLSNKYHKRYDVAVDENGTSVGTSGMDTVISSSLAFSLIQFAGGIVFVVLVAMLLNYFY